MINSPNLKRKPKRLFFDQFGNQESTSARWMDNKTETSLNDSVQLTSPEFKWSECLDMSPQPSFKQTLSSKNRSPDPMLEERCSIQDQILKPFKILQNQELQLGVFDSSFSLINDISSVSLSNSIHSRNQFDNFDSAPQIPILMNEEKDQIQMITAETLNERMNLEKNQKLKEKLVIIDCRHSYEYQGGHIIDAINIQDPSEIEFILFNKSQSKEQKIIVLYCEFSVKRSPEIYKYIRNCDRKLNAVNFPYLYYPDIYVLDLGYQNYFDNHKELCDGGYIPMKMPDFKIQYKKEKYQLRGWWRDIKNKTNNMRKSILDLPVFQQLL